MTQAGLRIVENENLDHPTDEQVNLYYFDVFEARQLLGWPDEQAVTKLCRSGKVFSVKVGKKYMIRPDQIAVLRDLIPHCRPNNLKEPQGGKVRFLLSKLQRWWTSA